jgi:hypothetical protein
MHWSFNNRKNQREAFNQSTRPRIALSARYSRRENLAQRKTAVISSEARQRAVERPLYFQSLQIAAAARC